VNPLLLYLFASLLLAPLAAQATENDLFKLPVRGFVSERPATNWEHCLLTGNGTVGAMVMGEPYEEKVYLSHAGLFLPKPESGPLVLNSQLETIRQRCFAGDFAGAAEILERARVASEITPRDPFTSAFMLWIKQPKGNLRHYQRAVDFMTAETSVAVEDERGSFRRSLFASRPDKVMVLRLAGSGDQSAEFSCSESIVDGSSKTKKDGSTKTGKPGKGNASRVSALRNGLLYFNTLFQDTNQYNPNYGYVGLGKVIAAGGQRSLTATSIRITDAREILVLIKILPLRKGQKAESSVATLAKELDAVTPDYAGLLAAQARVHGELMGRVKFSLDAPATERAKSSEQLNQDSLTQAAPLAKIERAFDAGRYNLICSTGFYPPNLQGLWCAGPLHWSGSFTIDGNLECAIGFLLPGNTPELMESVFRYFDARWPGFRDNARELYGARGFHVPAQLTMSPKEHDFSAGFPLLYWHTGAPWILEYYYDYFLYTGNRTFLAERAYPLLKEAAAFYEDFLSVTNEQGKCVFVPSYSPENSPKGTRAKSQACINATMDIASAKQLLRHAIASAKRLGCDADLQRKWEQLIFKLPDYEVGEDGSFREWLWPGLLNNDGHRHASHLYGLFDEMPAEIVENPALVKAVETTIRAHLDWRAHNNFKFGNMAFGYVQLGLASEHIGNPTLAQEVINILATKYWSSGMGSFHNLGDLFNMDISGGFPNLCASALVYADPGVIRFFPARPTQWQRGTLHGVRLRGGILLRELTWNGRSAKAVLVSDADQTVSISWPKLKPKTMTLRAKVPVIIEQPAE